MPMKYSGDNLQFPDNSIQSTAATGFGFKNRIINGDMRIDQRNAGASVTPSTDGTYTLDRWVASFTQGSKFSVQQNAGSVTPPTSYTNYLGVTSTSAYSVGSGDTFLIAQYIEGFNIADLGWGTANAQAVTLSFWVRSSLTGTFGGALANVTPNRSYPFSYVINSANTWEQKTITIAGDTSGTWATNNSTGLRIRFGLGSGSTFSGTAGSWASANYVQSTGSTSVVGTNGATFYITGVQLEKGSTATSFDYRPYGVEDALCKRYYEEVFVRFGTFNASAADQYNGQFKVTKRTTPTIVTYADTTPYAKTGASGNVRNVSASSNIAASAFASTGDVNGFTLNFTGVNPANIQSTNAASAEL